MSTPTFFKMWRNFKDNDIFLDDLKAWHVFEWLLGSCNYATGIYETTLRELAYDVHLPLTTTVHAIERLEASEMVVQTRVQRNTLFSICNWKHYQDARGTELGTEWVQTGYKEQGSQRNKEIKKDITNVISTPLAAALNDFSQMRKIIRKPLTARARELILMKLEKLAPGDVQQQITILEQSIANSWQGVFELKPDIPQTKAYAR